MGFRVIVLEQGKYRLDLHIWRKEVREMFDYYYGMEAEQFSFYRIPRLLIKDERFKGLSSDAKLLYGLMLDRMSLSKKNGWLDTENRVYIFYGVEEVAEDLCCSKATCSKILAELDSKNGIGLIERKRRGLGRLDIIYVKRFTDTNIGAGSNGGKGMPGLAEEKKEKKEENISEANSNTQEERMPSSEVKELNQQTSNNQISEEEESLSKERERLALKNQKSELAEVKNMNSKEQETKSIEFKKTESLSSYININYTNQSYNNDNNNNLIYPINPKEVNLNQEVTKEIDEMDKCALYIEQIKQNIEYDYFMKYGEVYGEHGDKELYEELFGVICDVVCVKRKSIRVNKGNCPYELIKSRFLKLTRSHLEYVIECMKKTAAKIDNIQAYMTTSLYNALNTKNHYYQQEALYDVYGYCVG